MEGRQYTDMLNSSFSGRHRGTLLDLNSRSVLERIGELNQRMVEDCDFQNRKVSLNEVGTRGHGVLCGKVVGY